MKLSEAVAVFLSQYKPVTRRSYMYNLRDMVNFIGDKPLESINFVHIAEYSDELDSRNYKSVYTWNKYIKTMKVFFNFCVSRKWIAESPAGVMRMRRIKQSVPKDKAISDDDVSQLLVYTQFQPKAHALVLFLADTGCRATGVSNLEVADIDFEKLEAVVTEKGKTRTVGFGPVCAQALKDWIAKRPPYGKDFVFPGDKERRGKAMLPSSASQIVRRCCREVGIKPRGTHAFRHRKGHQMADSKVAPSVAKTVLGHSNVSITMTHYYPDDWDRARRVLNDLAVSSNEDTGTVIQFPKKKSQ